MVFDPEDVAARRAKLANSVDRPSAARIYDYFIGGDHNFAIDQKFAQGLQARIPRIGDYARECRLFMGRAVRQAAEEGHTQFIDIGSGLPTSGSVHEICDQVRPQRDTHVVYIDNEPIAFAHAELLLDDLADANRHRAVYADLLDPVNLWQQVGDTGVIDLRKPVVLLISAVLHFIKDEARPDEALEFYRRNLPPGSWLVLSQMSDENPADAEEAEALRQLEEFYENTTNPGQLRTREEFGRFFGDLELLEPGLVWAPAWHPDGKSLFDQDSQSRIIAGVARKR
ncbi:MAG TPA: SAM-dependent methyltransferase [Pseudonocardiaceae bacterium]|jgi:O-methyltransferase involved in polyketide biosynthesis|nr:SAM-dependent methyltransferase [Pseudonocardiaceae bacterium]